MDFVRCDDGGRCHHDCGGRCWRRENAAPLSPFESWDDVKPPSNEAKVPCPRCGEEITVRFWEEVHPYGSTVAYEPMADFVDGCDCDLTDEEQTAVLLKAAKERR